MNNKALTRKALRRLSYNYNHFFLSATYSCILEYLVHAPGTDRTAIYVVHGQKVGAEISDVALSSLP